MKIAIIGTGGVGGYFGGKLAMAGSDVTFLARGEHLKALQQNGLRIKSIKGDFKIDPIKVTDNIKTIGFADLVIIALKSWQIKEIITDLIEIVNQNTTILPLQNGIFTADELKEQFDQNNVIGGSCRIFSKIESPGIINHFDSDPKIILGELNNSKTERIYKIESVLNHAGIETTISDNIQTDLWRKFIIVCVSGLLAVTKTTHGELRELKVTRQLMIELLTEIYNLSKKVGIQIETNYLEKAISLIDSFSYDNTGSLTRDVWKGKPSEIEYQTGTVVRLAEKYGIDVPINRFVYSCILPMEIKARKQ